ncbi:hypothetical protein HG535_0F04510 [Zygotorulaspora mrakii]|uniref:Ketopantoate reductase C-terminal domain-containing protein n=1 Tax=Zygotorulaspora mrakii TaxID=42260 RepID=A0A7H9B7I1_ZYGMR|nr:uncharacterized protein HG535_0F04510 [Zygotorulaspora mrakii]QLG73939.1 hypothetical protein HG535_0F04510 [Zygotorulaspora mrakii]
MGTVPRIYSVVNTPIASILACEIAILPNQPPVPQVVLLLNDHKKLNRFLDNDSKIIIDRNKGKNIHQTQFMAAYLPPVYSTGKIATIDNLIVSGQHSKNIVSSVRKYLHCLNAGSNLFLLNPPFGAIEHLYRNLWTTSESRPNLFVGISMKREANLVSVSDEFRLKLKCSGISMRVSPVPRDFASYSHESGVNALEELRHENDMLKLLDATAHNPNPIASISPLFYSYGDLLLIRLERLIVESCIEPLAALFGCRYTGELLQTPKSKDLILKLINEQVWILKCAQPFLTNMPSFHVAMDTGRLYELILKELRDKPKLRSQLNHSLNQLNQSNINQLTGYFVQLANYKKLDCRWNEVITGLVKGKAGIAKHRSLNYKYL